MDTKKAVIVFFSKDGNTRLGAKLLSDRTNSETIELKEKKKGNFMQALMKKGSEIKGSPWAEIKDTGQIYLMTPIWASNGTPAMNTFLRNADFNGKTVCVITFQQFEDLRNSDKVHAYIGDIIKKKNGIVHSSYALVGGKMGHYADEASIKQQIDKIDIL